MVPTAELKRIAKTRLGDARVLMRSQRYDGAMYLCGYTIEVALKARVCQDRNWEGQPENERENPSYQILRTHKLDDLLELIPAIQKRIKGRHFPDWSIIRTWSPEARYVPIGNVSRGDAAAFVRAAEILLKVILP